MEDKEYITCSVCKHWKFTTDKSHNNMGYANTCHNTTSIYYKRATKIHHTCIKEE